MFPVSPFVVGPRSLGWRLFSFFKLEQLIGAQDRGAYHACRHCIRRLMKIMRAWQMACLQSPRGDYLHELTDGFVAERVISEWVTFYNIGQPHTAFDKRTPGEVHFNGNEIRKTT